MFRTVKWKIDNCISARLRGVVYRGVEEEFTLTQDSANEPPQNTDLQSVDRIRSEFPETWLWLDFVSG